MAKTLDANGNPLPENLGPAPTGYRGVSEEDMVAAAQGRRAARENPFRAEGPTFPPGEGPNNDATRTVARGTSPLLTNRFGTPEVQMPFGERTPAPGSANADYIRARLPDVGSVRIGDQTFANAGEALSALRPGAAVLPPGSRGYFEQTGIQPSIGAAGAAGSPFFVDANGRKLDPAMIPTGVTMNATLPGVGGPPAAGPDLSAVGNQFLSTPRQGPRPGLPGIAEDAISSAMKAILANKDALRSRSVTEDLDEGPMTTRDPNGKIWTRVRNNKRTETVGDLSGAVASIMNSALDYYAAGDTQRAQGLAEQARLIQAQMRESGEDRRAQMADATTRRGQDLSVERLGKELEAGKFDRSKPTDYDAMAMKAAAADWQGNIPGATFEEKFRNVRRMLPQNEGDSSGGPGQETDVVEERTINGKVLQKLRNGQVVYKKTQ